MVQNVREHGLPCHVSFTAGTYVCNCVMYNVLHLCATKYPNKEEVKEAMELPTKNRLSDRRTEILVRRSFCYFLLQTISFVIQ